MKTLFFLCIVAAVCLADSSFDSLADVEAHIKNHTHCVPIPCVYRVCTKYIVPKDERGCPKCPICEKKMPCPLPSCPLPAFCKKFEPTYFQFNGQSCQGCPKCADRIALVENEQSDLSIKQPVACPLFKCARPACTKTIPTTFNLNGKICNGCPKCAEKLEEIAEQEPALPSCPHIRCAIPKCEPGVKLVYSTLTFGGKKCRGCATCEKKQELRGCPHIKCAMPMCKPGTKLVYSTIMFAGKPCRGCARCAEPENNVACPMPKCAMIACEKSEPTTFEFMGKTCKGCPRCVRN